MLDILTAILIAGLTTGALYALATVGLSLVWGSMGMLNMAHAAMLTLGGYSAFTLCTVLGLPVIAGFAGAILVGAVAGGLLYVLIVRNLLKNDKATFESNVMIATVGIGIALENAILLTYGGQPLKQPISATGSLVLGPVSLPYQNMLIVFVVIALMAVIALLLGKTRMGRAIRATAQNREAAQLMGVAVNRVYFQVLVLSGAIAGICGVMVSSMTQLSPPLGNDPMLKAFIMCVVAGLGNLPGAVAAAFGLALLEAFVQYVAGARWGFPTLLFVVIAVLIWRPAGLFGRVQIRRM
ncbi:MULTISPECIES: branched-chain amino acid ABC transporter permease [unclassified Shinella]|jgi:branched-chain amino acid transport system permease protein|uniref:branched-chain amino acid ABC transporter permease n=1 Tax=unclassified Shinella TaxID=2643062 RepID=UPI0003C5661E|nr:MULTISPECIES: branched-chain amino acid ABC transporter permease [unclassified Shinella]EYR81065.1 amino acid/amide ABC transporter membrane protein 1, HAAT family [Shinella sp. DD12]KNY14181.1 branched-chain amino acid ABC transporter permease [Shinella sp. SUS2]KOC74007.1 branched-chain amino acid ABC transporter permease [Shinella sp. GWS1]MCO5151846.1 branched-chain amino acid ABC transporter permease [Shinella sp.]MDC7265447.1 branched-chain amino acid ABC transporter permease [Shinell